MPKQTFRKVHYVKDYTPKQAFEDSLVSDLYKTPEEAELRIRQFANLLAPKGMFRETIKHNKCNMFKAMLPSLKDELWSPFSPIRPDWSEPMLEHGSRGFEERLLYLFQVRLEEDEFLPDADKRSRRANDQLRHLS